jgi:uncharacterized membrane protein YhaH (DUF805 family)
LARGPAMNALSELFSFEGRISRVGYLWRMMGVGLGMGVLAFAGRTLLTAFVRPSGLGAYDAGAHGLAVGIVLLVIWSSAAVTTRRVRDMGLEPVHILPAYIALWIVYTQLLQPLSQLRADKDGLLLIGWAAMQALPPLSLLLWPGHSTPPPVLAGYEPAQPTEYMNWRGHA